MRIIAVSDSKGVCLVDKGIDVEKLKKTKERVGSVKGYPGCKV